MKVATIAFGYSQNLGALLQVYALREHIQSIGHECDIIHFKDFDNRPFETVKGIIDGISDILCFGKCKKKIEKINVFRKKYLRFTEKCYHSTEEMDELNDIYDVFIAGSDQIWNVHNGIVDEFFLSFVNDKRKKIAYSASFGLSKLPEEYLDSVKKGLDRFDSISIRETTGVKIAEELTGKTYPQTLDPVFLKPESEWGEMCGERKIKEKYIFVYPTQISKKLTKTVKAAKKQYRAKVYSLFDFLGVDRVVKDADPIDFLNYIKNAELIITSSFHATAFSIIFHKNFRIVPHSTTGSRTVDLLNDLKLGNKSIIHTTENLDFDSLNYDEADEILNQKIQYSKNYLISNI